MPNKTNDSNTKALALCTTIALGALIAHNLPRSKPKPRSKPPPPRRTPSPPPAWRRVPPLVDYPHYREERYYLRYRTGEEPGDLLQVIDQRPVNGRFTGPEVREAEAGKRGFEVERYYRLNGEEAGPQEAHRIVKKGYPKWDR